MLSLEKVVLDAIGTLITSPAYRQVCTVFVWHQSNASSYSETSQLSGGVAHPARRRMQQPGRGIAQTSESPMLAKLLDSLRCLRVVVNINCYEYHLHKKHA